MDVRIETLDPIHVARIRHVGPYAEVGPCFERLFRWAAVIGVPTGRVLTLSYDDDDAVAPERLRSDACVELRTDHEPPPGVVLGPVGGGPAGRPGDNIGVPHLLVGRVLVSNEDWSAWRKPLQGCIQKDVRIYLSH